MTNPDPTPPAAPPSNDPAPAGGGGPSDGQVAQSYYDEWAEGVDADIAHLKQAFAELAQVKTGGSNAGSTAPEPGTAAGAGAPQGNNQGGNANPPVSGSGQQGAGAAGGKPEQPPKPNHIYFRSLRDLFGG